MKVPKNPRDKLSPVQFDNLPIYPSSFRDLILGNDEQFVTQPCVVGGFFLVG